MKMAGSIGMSRGFKSGTRNQKWNHFAKDGLKKLFRIDYILKNIEI